MNVVFIHRETENIGIEYLSAVLKEHGHRVSLLFDPGLFDDDILSIERAHVLFDYSENILSRIAQIMPDLICFSTITDNYRWACTLASRIKEGYAIPVVFGGVHASLLPHEVIQEPCIDFVIEGEGEYALLDLANALEQGSGIAGILNVWSKKGKGIVPGPKRPLVENLDTLPFLDKGLFYAVFTKNRIYTTITGRGCPYGCSFCYNPVKRKSYRGLGRFLRRRSPQNVISELNLRRTEFRIKYVVFHDEEFCFDRQWLREFAERYRTEVALPYMCWVSPASLDKEKVRLLKESGCRAVEMGVESINPRIRKKILHRSESNEEIRNAIRLLNQYKIFVTTDNLFGLPTQDIHEVLDLHEFYLKNPVDQINIYGIKYFPGTEIRRVAEAVGGEKSEGDVCSEKRYTKNLSSLRVHTTNIQKMTNLLLIQQVVPKRLIEKIFHNSDLLKWVPSTNLYGIYSLLTKLIAGIVHGKKGIYLNRTPLQYGMLYLKYMTEHILFSALRVFPRRDRGRSKKLRVY